jgi:hypothetical protein
MCQSLRSWIHGEHLAKEWNGIELQDEDNQEDYIVSE